MSKLPNVNRNQFEINRIQNQYPEHIVLNEFNIQNDLNKIRENLRNQIRSTYQIPKANINPLENYGKEIYYGISSQVRPRGLEKENELLKLRTRSGSLEKGYGEDIIIMPRINLLRREIYRERTIKPLVTIEITPKRDKPIPPPPPPPPSKPPISFGWPKISIRAMTFSGLVPELSRGIKSMYDIQYVLSRLRL